MTDRYRAYDKATFDLMRQANRYDIIQKNEFTLPEMVYLLRESFKKGNVRKKILDFDFCNWHLDPATGFCLISSYYIYDTTGDKNVWQIFQANNPNFHCWLHHKETNEDLDITKTQFKYVYPYDTGKPYKKVSRDNVFLSVLQQRAHLLGHMAGME